MLDFYGLSEQPFGTTPDPRFLYALPSMSEAIASLSCGMEYRVGFAALIADPGMGKTTLLLDLLNRYNGRTQTAFIFNTQCSGAGLLRQIAADLGAPSSSDLTETHENLKAFFVSHGAETPVLVVIDEAQNLDEDALEAVRLLSDCETSDRKLLHIILAGQPQLTAKLQDPNLLQLQQRITMITRLDRLTEEQTAGYIAHRVSVAGGNGRIFADDAVRRIAEQSDGIPREINRLCFNALLLGCATEQHVIDQGVVDEVIGDLELPRPGRATARSYGSSRILPIDRAPERDDAGISEVPEEVPALSSRTGTDAMSQYSASTLPWLLRVELAQIVRGEPLRAAGPLRPATEPVTPREKDSETQESVTAATVFEPLPEVPRRSLSQQFLDITESRQLRAMFAAFSVAMILAAILGVIWAGSRHQPTMNASPMRQALPSATKIQQSASEGNALLSSKKAHHTSSSSHKAAAESAPPASEIEIAKIRPQISPPSATRTDEAQTMGMGGARVEAKLLQRMEPQYPPAALTRHIEGSVRLSLSVGIDGKVKVVHVESGNPLFLRDAVKAAREWIYQPATLNGQRIPTEVPATVRFTLPEHITEGQ